MKLIAQVKLQPSKEQASSLKKTLEAANNAANFLSDLAWDTKTFKQYDLHKAGYYDARQQFGLAAQIAVRIIAKVADAYKLDKKSKRRFRLLGSIAYDDRILTWKIDKQAVSLWTLNGRITMPFVAGERQLEMLKTRQGEADLVHRNGEFYLYQTCTVDEELTTEIDGFLGVDLGIVNIATTSDGETFSGAQIEATRQWHNKRKAILQSVGTKSAKRRLRKLSSRQSRFQKKTNHEIAKKIVSKAKDTGLGIALEDLTHIRKRTTARRQQRARQSNWTFSQLRTFIEYKAKLLGVHVVAVDPRNSSKTCSCCGHCEDKNRPTRDQFVCCVCRFLAPADHNAAVNLAARAKVNLPMVSALPLRVVDERQSFPL